MLPMIFFILLICVPTFGQSVKNICPDAIENKVAPTIKDLLDRMKNYCDYSNQDPKIEGLVDDILLTVGQISTIDNVGMDQTTPANLALIRRLMNDYQIKQQPLSPDFDMLNKTGNQVVDLFKEVANTKSDDARKESCRNLLKAEKEYMDQALKVIRSTKKGEEIYKCYTEISGDHSNLLTDGKLPMPRLIEGQNCEDPKMYPVTNGGTFNVTCDQHEPFKGKANLSINLSVVSPLRGPIVLAHEMKHGCDSKRSIPILQKIKRHRNTSVDRMPAIVKETFMTLFPDNELSASSSTAFKAIQKNLKEPRFREDRLREQDKLQYQAYRKLDLKNIQAVEEFIKSEEVQENVLNQEEALFTAVTEIEAHQVEDQIFKELVPKEPFLCKAVRSSSSRWGPILTTIGDEMYTAEKMGFAKEILRVYSLKNMGINPQFLYLMQADCKKPDPRNCIIMDAAGFPVLKPETKDAFRKAGIEY